MNTVFCCSCAVDVRVRRSTSSKGSTGSLTQWRSFFFFRGRRGDRWRMNTESLPPPPPVPSAPWTEIEGMPHHVELLPALRLNQASQRTAARAASNCFPAPAVVGLAALNAFVRRPVASFECLLSRPERGNCSGSSCELRRKRRQREPCSGKGLHRPLGSTLAGFDAGVVGVLTAFIMVADRQRFVAYADGP